MLKKNKNRRLNESLDQLGRAIVRVSAANETEAEDAASSPFLYTRLRSRIAVERQRREEGEGWLTMLAVVWRTVPAMALVAVFALVMFLFSGTGASNQSGGFSDEALLGTRNGGVEQVVFADRQPSRDEVLSTILGDDEQGASK